MTGRSTIALAALLLLGTFLAFGFADQPLVAIAGIVLNAIGLLWLFAALSNEPKSGRSRR